MDSHSKDFTAALETDEVLRMGKKRIKIRGSVGAAHESDTGCPSAEKLLQLGETRKNVQQQQQVHASDPHTAAEILLKISSLYSEEPETKTAVLETIDAVLKKLLSGSELSSYCFLSTLLVMMGLLKGEGKVKKVPLVPGQLLCLEHAVQQEYFPQHVAFAAPHLHLQKQ
ncbi:hypothetical protein KUCAC02_028074 [Chaenocephalus aceratus]|uniref:Uncharacterized protein n=1 Tax=Chaenocephalus aceratus TaxID=36190 RepID=A0ACB9X2C4_CHAAC|nr:hypothetical protein KUCAC02_028074 [Chaenocephalus aceratus]